MKHLIAPIFRALGFISLFLLAHPDIWARTQRDDVETQLKDSVMIFEFVQGKHHVQLWGSNKDILRRMRELEPDIDEHIAKAHISKEGEWLDAYGNPYGFFRSVDGVILMAVIGKVKGTDQQKVLYSEIVAR